MCFLRKKSEFMNKIMNLIFFVCDILICLMYYVKSFGYCCINCMKIILIFNCVIIDIDKFGVCF